MRTGWYIKQDDYAAAEAAVGADAETEPEAGTEAAEEAESDVASAAGS